MKKSLDQITNENNDLDYKFIPDKAYFTLKECCALKGLNYKTACNQVNLQPNKGVPSTTLGKRKFFRRDVLIKWVFEGFCEADHE